MISHTFYLSRHNICHQTSVFSASFAEVACVKDCFIIADSLKDSIDILYTELPKVSSFTSSDIDNLLLSVNFHHRVGVLPF